MGLLATSSEYTQLPLFSATEEAMLYHAAESEGFFSLLTRIDGKMRQQSYRLSSMPQVLALVPSEYDTYLSQAVFFRRNRRACNLRCVGLAFIDLDTYNIAALKGRTPEQQAAAVMYHCEQEGIPLPSLIVFSGRGLQVKWLFKKAIPRQALPRWHGVQNGLVEAFLPLGADPRAKDVSRVLRLVDTVNTKSGERCRVIASNEIDGEPIKYQFDQFSDEIRPHSRYTIEAWRRNRSESRVRPKLTLVKGDSPRGLKMLSGRRLAWDRWEDLGTLFRLRGGVNEGNRMLYLLYRLNFMALSGAITGHNLWYETVSMASAIDPNWQVHRSDMSSLFDKIKANMRGEKIRFNGRDYPPLYTPRNDTLIQLFQITEAEQRQLKTIISPKLAAERHALRQQAYRAGNGAVSRAAYLKAANDKCTQARLLRAKGLTQAKIAEITGCDERTIRRYLSDS